MTDFDRAFRELYEAGLRWHFSKKTTAEQIELVTRNYQLIQFAADASEELQLAAVHANPAALEYIKNPCESARVFVALYK